MTTEVDAFDEKVKKRVLNLYREKGIKPECERCFIVTDPHCPDFPHICALEEGLKEPGKNKDWILENLSHCITMRRKRPISIHLSGMINGTLSIVATPTLLQRIRVRVFGTAFSHKEVVKEGDEPVSFFFARCPDHGYYTDYSHGWRENLKCPVCHPREES